MMMALQEEKYSQSRVPDDVQRLRFNISHDGCNTAHYAFLMRIICSLCVTLYTSTALSLRNIGSPLDLGRPFPLWRVKHGGNDKPSGPRK